jgi:hypothetical protein
MNSDHQHWDAFWAVFNDYMDEFDCTREFMLCHDSNHIHVGTCFGTLCASGKHKWSVQKPFSKKAGRLPMFVDYAKEIERMGFFS